MTNKQISLTEEHEQFIALMTRDGKMTYEDALAEVISTQKLSSRQARSEARVGVILSFLGIVIPVLCMWGQIELGRIRIGTSVILLLIFGLSIRYLFISIRRLFKYSFGKVSFPS